jgi:DeoR/GlpR family transcriptional regulator of sugar metabolism
MPPRQNKELTDMILDAITEHGSVTTKQIADLLKVSPATAAGRLTYLRAQGRIVGKRATWAFRLEDLNVKPKQRIVNQSFTELSNIFYNIVRMGATNENNQHS